MAKYLLPLVLLLAACGRPVDPPLDSRESLPDWARPGLLRCARWDGGPIEADKGMMSGWPNFTAADEKGVMAATRDWYNPRTVAFLKAAHINWAWVTWSVGFSHSYEEKQWELLRTYIGECHRNGIKVTAYMSVANMFWKQMFSDLPESRRWVELMPDGSPRFYSFPHRYMADISRRPWLDYVRVRARRALAAGADAFWIDNTFAYHGADNVRRLLNEIHAEARQAGRKVVIESNYNRNVYTWARFQNGVTTEDGQEPGWYPEDPVDRRLVTNAGLLRYHFGVSDGWRPVSAEYGGRHRGERFTTPMEPAKWQLSIAECAAFQAAFEPFFEGMFLRDLHFGEKAALDGLAAIGRYNGFLEKNAAYFTGVSSAARVAVLADATDRVVPLLNQLARRNVQFDVLFNYQEPPAETLARYAVLLAPHTNPLSDRLAESLRSYAEAGGKLVLIQDAGLFGSSTRSGAFGFAANSLPDSRTERRAGKGAIVYHPRPPDVAALASELGAAAPATVSAPANVLFNVVRQPEARRLLVHLLNYQQKPIEGVTLTAPGAGEVQVLSPDFDGPRRVQAEAGLIRVPAFTTWAVVAVPMK